MKKIISSISKLALLLVPAFTTVLAKATEELPEVSVKSAEDISKILINIRNWFSGLVAIISVFMILYAGFQFLTAAGNPEKVGKAKNTLMYGLIGIAIAILATGILKIISSFFIS